MDGSGTILAQLTSGHSNESSPTWSPDGEKIAFQVSTPGSTESTIHIMDANGGNVSALPISSPPSSELFHPEWLPDGRRIAFTALTPYLDTTANNDVYVVDSDGADLTPVLTGPTDDCCAVWSPDGTKIAFLRNEGGVGVVYVMNSDGTELTGRSGPGDVGPPTWAPDGKSIAVSWTAGPGDSALYSLDVPGTSAVRLTAGPGPFEGLRWSPDGKRITFSRGELSGDIYVLTVDTGEEVNLTNARQLVNGGAHWRPLGSTTRMFPRSGGPPAGDSWEGPFRIGVAALTLGLALVLLCRRKARGLFKWLELGPPAGTLTRRTAPKPPPQVPEYIHAVCI